MNDLNLSKNKLGYKFSFSLIFKLKLLLHKLIQKIDLNNLFLLTLKIFIFFNFSIKQKKILKVANFYNKKNVKRNFILFI